MADDTIQNYTFDELKIGMSASLTHKLTHDDIKLFAATTGDPILAGLAEGIMLTGVLGKRPTHAVLSGTLLSRLIGTELPGPGTSILAESIRYERAVGVGDSLTITVTVKDKRSEGNIVILECAGRDQYGDPVLSGTMEVSVLTQKFSVQRMEEPTISVQEHDSYEAILKACKRLPAVVTAVAHPCDESSLRALMDAAEAGLILPILVGPAERIRKVAREFGFDISRFRIENTPHSHASAERAVELVREGEAEALMKGSLHTDELLSAVVDSATGLRTARRIHHNPPGWVLLDHFQITTAHAAIKFDFQIVHPVPLVAAHLFPFQTGFYVNVQVKREIGRESARRKIQNHPQCLQVEAATVALIS